MTFDEWRARYDQLTFEQHQAVNAEWALLYPVQRSFNEQACLRFLQQRQPRTVVEVGGWDGYLAGLMLPAVPSIESWTNYDITPNVPQTCFDPAYRRVVLDDWPWNRQVCGDVLVASHVLEHMRAGEIERLLSAWTVDSVYLDVPVGAGVPVWERYHGSHILEIGADGLVGLLANQGFEPAEIDATGSFIAFFDREAVAA